MNLINSCHARWAKTPIRVLTAIIHRALTSTVLLVGVVFAPLLGHSQTGIPGYVVLPLANIGRANQATIRVTINGKPTHLILDTGASAMTLDSRFYQGARSQKELKPDELPENLPTKAKANGIAVDIGYISSMQAGGMDFGKGPVIVTNLGSLFGTYNNLHGAGSIAGLMGEDVLRRYGAIIDWRRRGVYFNTDPSKRIKLGPSLVANGWTPVPMTSTNARHFVVRCTVSGKPVKLLVDTGAQFTSFASGVVPLDVLYNRDTGSSMARVASTGLDVTMLGMSSVLHPARLESWKIGDFTLQHSNVAVQKFPPGLLNEQSEGDAPMLGLLGAEYLAANNAIIDVAGSTLYLKASDKKPEVAARPKASVRRN